MEGIQPQFKLKFIEISFHDVEENLMMLSAAGNATRISAHRAREVTHVVEPY
jgi:hypothetical protein